MTKSPPRRAKDFLRSFTLMETSFSSFPRITVIRGNELKDVSIKVKDLRKSFARRGGDFVMISGLVLQDLSPRERAYMNEGESGVIVRTILDGSMGAKSEMNTFDLIKEIHINGARKKITKLYDLKQIIDRIRASDLVEFVFYPTLTNQGKPIRSAITKAPLHHEVTTLAQIP